MNSKLISLIAWWLVIIGGINWGLVGLVDLNLVSTLLHITFLDRLVYILVGISAGYLLYEKFFAKKIL